MSNNNKMNTKETASVPEKTYIVSDKIELVGSLILENRLDEAHKILSELIDDDSSYADQIYCQLGIINIRQGNYNEAEQNLLKAVHLNPELTDAFYNLGWLYETQGKYQNALSFYKETILQSGDDGEIFERMGLCCLAINNKKDAEVFFDEALRFSPDSVLSAAHLADIYFRRGETDKAQEVLKYSLVSNPNIPELHITLGTIQKELGDYEHAMAHFHKAVTFDENNSVAFNSLGECCIALGLEKQAEPFFAKAAKLDDMNFSAVYNLGKLYYEKKKYENAVVILNHWLERHKQVQKLRSDNDSLNVDAVPILNLLGSCFKKQNKTNEAEEVWKQSLELAPQQDDIKNELESSKPLHKKITLKIDD